MNNATKMVAVHLIGALTEEFGGRVLSLFAETVAIFSKILKTSSELSVKIETINSLARAFKGAGKGVSEQTVKELMKMLKIGINDKILSVRVAYAECFQAIVRNTNLINPATPNDFDAIFSPLFKAFDASNYAVRRSASAVIASILANTQTNLVSIAPSTSGKKGKSSSKQSTDGTNETDVPAAAEAKSLLSGDEMLSYLSAAFIKYVGRCYRVGIAETYAALFIQLGTSYVEAKYTQIVRHFTVDILSNPKIVSLVEPEYIFVRELVTYVLRNVIGQRILSEEGQVLAVRSLSENWLSKVPSSSYPTPPKSVMVAVLNELAGLLLDLGGLATAVQDLLVDPLVKWLAHPSHSVQVAAAWCLRCFTLSLPSTLSKLISHLHSFLSNDLPKLCNSTNQQPYEFKKHIGYSYGLAAMMTVIPCRPLYVSFEISTKVFALSSQLLKSTSKDLRCIMTQTRVAWNLIGGLMSLGPSFVKIHLSQLLLLWKNALPKLSAATVKDALPKNDLEMFMFLHHREAALASLYSFLFNNRELVISDVSKRIIALLNNTLTTMSLVPLQSMSSVLSNTISPASPTYPSTLKLHELDFLTRKRLFQCFALVNPITSCDTSFPLLLKLAVEIIAVESSSTFSVGTPYNTYHTLGSNPNVLAGSGVWNSVEFGVSGLLRGFSVAVTGRYSPANDPGRNSSIEDETWVLGYNQKIEAQLHHPIIGAPDYDPVTVYMTYSSATSVSSNYHRLGRPLPLPAPFALVDAAIEILAMIIPYVSPQLQEGTLEQFSKVAKQKFDKVNKKVAFQLNTLLLSLGILQSMMSTMAKGREKNNPSSSNTSLTSKSTAFIWELVQPLLGNGDPFVRNCASEVVGRLASVSASNALNTYVQTLVDEIVKNRDPEIRAGCALALSSIHSHSGGLAANTHLKSIVGIVHSLSVDPHPVVHSWSLHSLWSLIESAGLMFGPYINSTLGIITKILMSEAHEPGAGMNGISAGYSGLNVVYQSLGRVLYALIGTLGPELQSSKKISELVLNLIEVLKNDSEQFVVVEAIRCIQHLILVAPSLVDTVSLVPFLQSHLTPTTHLQLKKTSLTCLWQLVQRDVSTVLSCCVGCLEEQLFSLLDTDNDANLHDGVKKVLTDLVEFTGPTAPSKWLDICRFILTKSNAPVVEASSPTGAISGGETDDDADTIQIEQAGGQVRMKSNPFNANSTIKVLPRWRTQLLALVCLRQVVAIIKSSVDAAIHLDLASARKMKKQVRVTRGKSSGSADFLVFRVSDLIKMAFTAATAAAHEMRSEGLNVLQDVLDNFSDAKDPDYEGHALLEQYQAQFSSALTPAFSPDSSPEILCTACHVCARYVASGITDELYTLGRVLKLLISALDKCKDDSTVAEVADLSYHAKVMVKVAVLTSWAELHLASQTKSYLVEVVQPNVPALVPLWLSTLRDFAQVKLDSDILAMMNGGLDNNSGLDAMYAVSTKEVVLPFYLKSWTVVLRAVTALIDTHNDLIVPAIKSFGFAPSACDIDTPKMFYTLYGLIMEPLSSTLGSTEPETLTTCLLCLKQLLRPQIVGGAFMDKNLVIELMNVFDRLLQTQESPIHLILIKTLHQLISDFAESLYADDVISDGVYNRTSKLYNVLKLLIHAIIFHVPDISAAIVPVRKSTSETIEIVQLIVETFNGIISHAPSQNKGDVIGLILFFYTTLLQNEHVPNEVAPKILLALKCIIDGLDKTVDDKLLHVLPTLLQSTCQSLLDYGADLRLDSGDGSTDEFDTHIKNTLLAATLLVTACPQFLRNNLLQQRHIDLLQKCLREGSHMVALTSLQCMRSLVQLCIKPEESCKEVGKNYVAGCLPHVVVFLQHKGKVNHTKPFVKGDKSTALIEEAIMTMLTTTAVLEEPKRPALLLVVIPTFVSLLDNTISDAPSYLHSLSLTNLLTIAASPLYTQSFKLIISQLSNESKTKLENAFRVGVVNNRYQAATTGGVSVVGTGVGGVVEKKEPTIQLKMDFANFG
ncbi:armadillo-type protein [Paraphysoderma sedebokerense]|nr:armadillo-type protein [Paraphysoderma sedebokerense]